MQRYFTLDKNLKLDINDIHHIKNVMRLKIGELIEVVYNNEVHICEILYLDKNDIKLKIIEKQDNNNELNKHITIAFSITKEEKIDLILQKCTELGIREFVPLELSRCNVKIDKNKIQRKLERWQAICKEASEQSKRNIIPKVNNIYKIQDIINLDYDLKIVCSVNQSVINIKNVLHNNPNCDKIIFVIGPEGGITEHEEKYLKQNNFILVSLGKRILRTETAPIMIGSILNYEYME